MHMTRRRAITVLSILSRARGQDNLPDLRSVPTDLLTPETTEGTPSPGKRVRQSLPAYAETNVHHTIYLPADWRVGKRYPVIIEYAGNGNYSNQYGDVSTGEVEGSNLGFGISAGMRFIWMCLPYVNTLEKKNQTIWWGDIDATVRYAVTAVRQVCEQYGGDPKQVIITGFSRGAIGCNYIGLHNDEIAKLWRAFIPYSHYDGVITTWPYTGADRDSAFRRLSRLQGRPVFVCQEKSVEITRAYIKSSGVVAPFTFQTIGFHNHSDSWVLRDLPERRALRKWLDEVLRHSQVEN